MPVRCGHADNWSDAPGRLTHGLRVGGLTQVTEQENTRAVVGVSIAGDGEEELHAYTCSECGARLDASYAPEHCGQEMEPVEG
jgi:hypothetical protein